MKKLTSTQNDCCRQKFSTKAMARKLLVEENTPRSAYHRQGHYLGMRPVKLPNGRLLWDVEEVEHLLLTGDAPISKENDESPNNHGEIE